MAGGHCTNCAPEIDRLREELGYRKGNTAALALRKIGFSPVQAGIIITLHLASAPIHTSALRDAFVGRDADPGTLTVQVSKMRAVTRGKRDMRDDEFISHDGEGYSLTPGGRRFVDDVLGKVAA